MLLEIAGYDLDAPAPEIGFQLAFKRRNVAIQYEHVNFLSEKRVGNDHHFCAIVHKVKVFMTKRLG